MPLKPARLAPLIIPALAALACNLSRTLQAGTPSAGAVAGEMSLADALSVEPNDARPEVLRLMGVPDAFTLQWQSLEGQLVRWEEWSYVDSGARFDFVDGELAWTVDLEPPPDGAVYAHAFNPLDFDPSMSPDQVQAMLPDQALEEASLAEADIPAGVALAGDQILLGFDGGHLVYVQTFLLGPGGEAVPSAPLPGPSAAPSPSATLPGRSATLLSDDFDSAGQAAPLFGPEFMAFSVENGEGALTSLSPGGVLPVMYAAPEAADFALEVDVRFPDARPGSRAGILFRSDDAPGGLAYYYQLSLRPAAPEMSLDLWKDGAFSSVATASIAPGVVDQGGVNHLRLEVEGEQVRAFVHGDLVLEATDARLPGPGIFGLSLVAEHSPETVYFDNLRVETVGGE